jgi:hypothetical protein
MWSPLHVFIFSIDSSLLSTYACVCVRARVRTYIGLHTYLRARVKPLHFVFKAFQCAYDTWRVITLLADIHVTSLIETHAAQSTV